MPKKGTIPRACVVCGAECFAWPYQIRSGQGRCCSAACARASRRGTSPCTTTPQERFWGRVDQSGPVVRPGLGACWLWLGPKDRKGYGTTHLTKQRKRGAHQAAWLFTNGHIPDGMWVLHKCDNPPCVRPSHLFLGTSDDNIRDKVAKGRQARGETHWSQQLGASSRFARGNMLPQAKLTPSMVQEIRRLSRVENWSARRIAKHIGVSPSAIDRILLGVSWAHVP